MAHEQAPRQEQSGYNRPSPYVADSGAVGHLGQPIPGGSDNTRSSDYPSDHPSRTDTHASDYPSRTDTHASDYPSRTDTHPSDYPSRTDTHPSDYPSRTADPGDPSHGHPSQAPGDRGLHYGGKQSGASGDTQPVSEIERGQHQHPLQATHDTNIGRHEPFEQSPYVQVGETPGARSEQPPRTMGDKMRNAGQGIKETFTGYQERPMDAPQQQHKPGLTEKINNAVTGQYPGQGTATGNATADSGVPVYDGRADHQKHHAGFPQPVPPPGMYKPNTSAQDHYSPKYDQPASHTGEPRGAGYSDTTGGIKEPISGEPRGAGYSDTTGGTKGPISTPAEPNARHETPGLDNTVGAEHVGSHGKVYKEGPRDDNVKKEGLMSKVMDKLHIPCGPKHHKDTTKDTTL